MKTTAIPLVSILKHFWIKASKYPFLLLLLCFAPVARELFDLFPQFVLRDIINVLTKSGYSVTSEILWNNLMLLFLTIVGYRIVQLCLFWIAGYTMAQLVLKVSYGLLHTSFRYIHGHSISFFQDQFVGSLVKNMHRYVDAFEQVVDQVGWSILTLLGQIVFGQIILFSIHWVFGVVMLVWTIVYIVISLSISRYKSQYDFDDSKASARLTGHISDSFSNIIAVKSSAGFINEYDLFTHEAKSQNAFRKEKTWMNYKLEIVQSALSISFELVLLYVALTFVYRGLITPGDIVLILGSSLALVKRIWGVGRSINRVYAACTDAYEMINIFQTPYAIQDKTDAAQLQVQRGAIDFHEIQFAYGEYTLVNNLSLHIKAGEHVALVGHSGAGKSTLIKLLLRFYDVTGGSICINGQNITDVTQESLHRNIAFVPQEPVLFHRTIRDNIVYGCSAATEEEMFTAARQAHAHEFISQLPEGYNTFVGERGVKLSGGERQRIAIARALLSKAPIVIFDEATSALDSETEALIKDALHTLMQGKTTIIVAHRLSTIMEMDRILVLDAGKLVEQGTHEQLLAHGGIYQTLWSIQSGGFIGE